MTSQNPSNTPVSIPPGNTPSPALSPVPGGSPVPVGTSIAFDLGGWIHVQSVSGFFCAQPGPSNPPGLLVVPTLHSTYDQGTLQQVETYVTALLQNPGDWENYTSHRDTVPYPAFSASPDSFQLVAASNVKDQCNEILHITNIKNTDVQVTPAFVQFTADTHTNTHHYNLIDGCALLSLSVGCQGSVGGNENDYIAPFDLHPGKIHTRISCRCSMNILTLRPSEVAKVVLSYSTSSSNNLSFSLMPSFTLGSPGEKQIPYPAPQLQETFAFASASQFSCYNLDGQKFVGVAMSDDTWCI